MPAVNADPLTLPRLPEPAAGAIERPVAGVTAAPSGFEGEGFPVRRAFARVALEDLHPLIHMDPMGALEDGPRGPPGAHSPPPRRLGAAASLPPRPPPPPAVAGRLHRPGLCAVGFGAGRVGGPAGR